jgi:maltose alpha-D-glucosyltransferase/alpha-amylase
LIVDRPHWYRSAVFYEVMVRGFRDANGDGIGDLAGLIERLDHLHWLGVDCLWLMPIYESPMRDNGYDISDFFTVHPDFGTIEEVGYLLDQAHERGIRIITDLVVNHTSDQHPWFAESRSSRDNPKADWYVWNDDDERWPEARIIFVDTEPSNWTWDESRGQHYWHRFFAHQPDLNYDCPDVTDAMFEVMSHWLALGLDGFRLDAVPYLYERDGTNGENLHETHQWLKALRARIDDYFPGRVLLAEANQLPHEVVDYFGDGDECHMAFHFPLMPRMFKAMRDHTAATIGDALADTPEIPEGCQWGIFLRNHDELTLEMVTDDERDFMYRHYAPEAGMRRNVGIGRRLFPLLDDDRRQVELMHSLLLSLPGSPILYYGDEIGMGERMELGDRDPVRTPMQWDATANGGFSSAGPDQLYLPMIENGAYGFRTRNVAAQRQDESSFLCWLRNLLVLRRSMPFGAGTFEEVDTGHESIFGYVRDDGTTRILCLVNLAEESSTTSFAEDTHDGRLEVVASSSGVEVAHDVVLGPYGWAWSRVSR